MQKAIRDRLGDLIAMAQTLQGMLEQDAQPFPAMRLGVDVDAFTARLQAHADQLAAHPTKEK